VKEKVKLRDPLEIFQGRVPEHMKGHLPKNPKPRPPRWFQQNRAQQEASLGQEALDEQFLDDPNSSRGFLI
jgi:hypothetical protein